MEEKKDVFSKFSPKTNFFAGIGSALFLFFGIGFFVLLFMTLSKESNIAKNVENEAVAGEQETQSPQYTEIPLISVSDSDWVRGNKDGVITIVEYSDIECPYCKNFHETMKELIKKYPNDLKWVYRHMPLESLHPNAPMDAEATECAGEIGGQEKFWQYLDLLSSSDLSGGEKTLVSLANSIGVSKSNFEQCLSSGKYKEKVNQQINDGAKAAEASSYLDSDNSNDGRWGTPFSVILFGDEKIPVPGAYPIEYLSSYIDSLLGKTSQ